MSYPAQRWAKAQILRVGRDPLALAVLYCIADAYRPDGRCPLNRAAIALRVGAAKRDTVAAALKRLSDRGILSYAVIRNEAGVVLGTRYTLEGFKADEWPKDRVGEAVMIEQATAAGVKPEPWWPRIGDPTLPPLNDLVDPSNADSPSKGVSPAEGVSPSNGYTLPLSNGHTLPPSDGGTLSPSNGHKTVIDGINGNNGISSTQMAADAAEDAFASVGEELPAYETLFDPEQRETETAIPAKEAPKAPKRATPCPYEKIRAAYAEILPTLPQPRALSDDLKKIMRARMKDLCKEEGLKTEAEIVEGFRRYFADVASSRFLMGQCDGGWQASLDWLMTAKNYNKVRAGNYKTKNLATTTPKTGNPARLPTAPSGRRPTDPQAGLGVCETPKGPHRLYTPEESAAASAAVLAETGWSE